ncbi:MAG: alpha/beta hydrolase [Deltaproteobacteria bacterium]|nr:alpha/beta hydrolase [Deltaproteobacteria bacterium]
MRVRLSDMPELPSEEHNFFLHPNRRLSLGPDEPSLTYQSAGRGSEILLLHGLWSTPYSFRHLLRPLSEQFRVILPDLFSPIRESQKSRPYDPAALAGLIDTIIKKTNLERPWLVAHGEAGLAGLWLALHQPERIAGLMIIGTAIKLPSSLRVRGWRLSRSGGVVRWAKRAFADPTKTALDMLDYADPAVASRQELRELARGWTHLPEALLRAQILTESLRPAFRKELLEKLTAASGQTFPVPLKLVYGKADRVAVPEQGQALNRDFPGSEFMLSESSGGTVQIEQHQWLTAAITEAAT